MLTFNKNKREKLSFVPSLLCQVQNINGNSKKKYQRVLWSEVFFFVQGLFYYIYSSINQYIWLFEISYLVIIFLDTVQVVVKRYGQEWYWFSITSYAYKLVVLTTIRQFVNIKVTVGEVIVKKILAKLLMMMIGFL